MTCVLQLDGVSKRYGALTVTDDISFRIEAGETYGILGPNGAGKTTLFNLISGDVHPDRGTVRFAGREISDLPPYRRCVAGIGRSYQVPRPFGGMTVFENLLVGASFGARVAESEAYSICVDVLERTGLKHKANTLAGGLTLLDRKRLELARALATRPSLLLLDEIAGGLTEPEARVLVDEIKQIKASGITILWIEHVMHALMAVADRLLVINFGRKLAEGLPAQVMEDPEVKRVYLGLEA
ncbi:branched-chain amino acid transport system ATP-binding protein [Paraburkholderia phenoliruptrix]|uniref:ABC transporter ATP-binding protein n=1 Tax=Paraburkholderia phenoliruptrix TaxID=252970 RepID=UPI0028553D84|nr:ABC transporter ATP-binding protein [Paraburkholderia phenoliruptrix]MDR6423796.1 branched-chain amino acid transport system ATP-binding protein [Paraburkholderia phenoliruptrix]